jgi:DNA-binding IclR family transcriptional regulator
LTEEGLLERGPGAYRLGLPMYELGVTVFPDLNLHEAARQVLDSLREAGHRERPDGRNGRP